MAQHGWQVGPTAIARRRARTGFPLAGSLAVVTGAGSGIGRATALALAGAGTQVVAVDLVASASEDTAAACRRQGVVATALGCDVASFAEVAELARQVFDQHGVPDVVVNNAGVGMSGGLAEMTIDDWQWIRSVNIDGVIHGCLAFGPAMLRRGSGHVVNVSSGLGYIMRAEEPAYVTTKAAVLALSRCLQADWVRHGVGVTAVCPGVTNTPILTSARFTGSQGETRRSAAQRVFQRGHRPETVAAAIVRTIGHRRAVVPVGWEARLGWALQRATPVSIAQRLARTG